MTSGISIIDGSVQVGSGNTLGHSASSTMKLRKRALTTSDNMTFVHMIFADDWNCCYMP